LTASCPTTLHITHVPDGRLWPEGGSLDYTAFHAWKWPTSHETSDGRKFSWNMRQYDPYSVYLGESLPAGMPPRGREINNLEWLPSAAGQARMIADLERLSKECDVVVWDSAIQCSPAVAEHLKRLFPVSVLYFGDDCPGSSEIKTFPIARYFDAMIYSMHVWNADTGERAIARYGREGIQKFYFLPMVCSHGLTAWIADAKFDPLAPRTKDIDLIWAGSAGFTDRRRWTMGHITEAANRHPEHRCRLHGYGMRDGHINDHPKGLAYEVAALYSRSLCGVNMPESSIFNCRLFDLWETGVVQLAHDPHGELRDFGFVDGEHFLYWNGDGEHLMGLVQQCKDNPPWAAEIARKAYLKRQEFSAEHTREKAMSRLYEDHFEF
jgi:hypothetical protein